MSNAILEKILSSAARTGANVIKDILSAQLGPTIGGIAGNVVNTVAGKLGVPSDQIPYATDDQVDHAVLAANDDPEIIRLYNDRMKMTIDLLRAEMDKSGAAWWTWAWRPLWMWLLGFLWLYNGVLLGIINAAVGSTIAPMEYDTLFAVTGVFTTFYLGGHTVKNFAQTRWGR